MTFGQLARHWKKSLDEAKNIARYINCLYKLDVVPVLDGSRTRWRGVLYAYDFKKKYVLMESKREFIDRDRAILSWTNQVRSFKISKGQAALMRGGLGVPTDVYLALKPVKCYEDSVQRIHQQMFIRLSR